MQSKLATAVIGDREGKHAAKSLYAPFSPLLPRVNDHFSIRGCTEKVSGCLQLASQFAKIIKFAVVRDPDSAPRALLERHPGLTKLSLPISRRLVQDTVGFVQPAFYPDMPFVALNERRPLVFNTPGVAPMDTPLDAVQNGQSLVMVELPAMLVGEVDPDLAEQLIWTLNRVLVRSATILDVAGRPVPVSPKMIGVACAQVAQVNAIRERLGPDLADVFVETANRFQGLERPLMFIQHPLSGRADATNFHLDAGRLCVMLSRHRVACWVFAREGVSRMLRKYAPRGDRSLGISDDPEFRGWRANIQLMRALEERRRIFRVPLRPRDVFRAS
jgi:AAA domain-containing protein